MSPEEIKRIRTKLGLTQERPGEPIGGGPRAFQKYEAGDLLPSRAIGSALALLDRDPEGLSVLHVRPHIVLFRKAVERASCAGLAKAVARASRAAEQGAFSPSAAGAQKNIENYFPQG